MTNIKTIVIASGLGLALLGNMAFGQAPQSQKTNSVPADASGSPGKGNGNGSGSGSGNGNSSNKKGHAAYPDQVKKMLDDIKAARAKFLQEQKDLQNKLKDASEADRDQIRQQMRDKRDQFLEQEKDMREEFQRRVNDLKSQLPNHGDVIDNAKDGAKGKGNQRKGGPN